MTRMSPQVLVQLARRTVERELKWTRTALHAPSIPRGAVSDDPLGRLSPLDVRLIQELGFQAYRSDATGQSDWPLPFGLTAHELALFGKARGILHDDHRGFLARGYTCKLRRRFSPTLGDRFLRWCDLPVDALRRVA